MNIDELKENLDWKEAFRFYPKPQPIIDFVGSLDTFEIEDVSEVLASHIENPGGSETTCYGLFILNDGRYVYMEAGCDYTGWDCQAGASSWVGDNFTSIWYYGLTDTSRNLLQDAMVARLAGIK